MYIVHVSCSDGTHTLCTCTYTLYLYNCAADLEDIAIGAEQIEYVVAVELPLSQAIYHEHRASSGHGWCSHHVVLTRGLGSTYRQAHTHTGTQAHIGTHTPQTDTHIHHRQTHTYTTDRHTHIHTERDKHTYMYTYKRAYTNTDTNTVSACVPRVNKTITHTKTLQLHSICTHTVIVLYV